MLLDDVDFLSCLGFNLYLFRNKALKRRKFQRVARRLRGSEAYFIGVRCPVGVIMDRRDRAEPGREDRYVTSGPDGRVPDVVLRWERAVHDPGVYDLEVDTSRQSPDECARDIRGRLDAGTPTAFAALAGDPHDH
ncbi:MAG: phosphotransferase-like protein [Acidimicrobiales bacterium]